MDVNKDIENLHLNNTMMESSDEWFILNDEEFPLADENGNERRNSSEKTPDDVQANRSENADNEPVVQNLDSNSHDSHSDIDIISDVDEHVDLDSSNLSSSYHRLSSSERFLPEGDEKNNETKFEESSEYQQQDLFALKEPQLPKEAEPEPKPDEDNESKKEEEPKLQQLSVGSIPNLHEDISDISSCLDKDVDLSPGVRAYKHIPNNMVNVKLNFFLAFAVTAVIFLGVGNYIGWTDNVSHQSKVTMEQVNKLKNLQDDLIVCMESEAQHISDKANINVCYKNSDYWKERFESLFNESKPLKDLLEKTQKNLYSDDKKENLFNDDCIVLKANQEFHKLKLYLLVKQMEHLQFLKSYEDIRNKEEISKQKLSKLKEENEDLKAKLKEEEEEDKLIEETMEERISLLEKDNEILRQRLNKEIEEEQVINDLQSKIINLVDENDDLKLALKQLEYQMNVGKEQVVTESSGLAEGDYEEEHDEISYDYSYKNSEKGKKDPFVLFDVDNHDEVKSNNVRIDQLRQKINQIMNENDDLKSIIARLRWSERVDEKNDEEQIDSSELQAQLKQVNDLLVKEQDETKKWKALYEEMMEKQVVDENNRQAQTIHDAEPNIDTSNNVDYEEVASDSGESKESAESEEKVEDNENSFQSWFSSINLTKLGDDFVTNSGILGNILNDLLQRATESNIAIPEQMYNLINSTQGAINDLQFQLVNKWKELDKLKDTIELTSTKLSKKMSETLIASMRKLQSAAEKFKNNNQKPFETRFSKLSNKIVKIKDWLDTKWNSIRDKYDNQAYSASGKFRDEEVVEDAAINEGKQKWYPRREKLNLNENFDNWLIERSREREIQRVHAESESDPNDENWYLKKTKLKFENNYEKSKKRKRNL